MAQVSSGVGEVGAFRFDRGDDELASWFVVSELAEDFDGAGVGFPQQRPQANTLVLAFASKKASCPGWGFQMGESQSRNSCMHL